jgi:hypothetical protein
VHASYLIKSSCNETLPVFTNYFGSTRAATLPFIRAYAGLKFVSSAMALMFDPSDAPTDARDSAYWNYVMFPKTN